MAARRASTQPVSSADPVKDYLQAIGGTPLLTAAQEVDLSKRIEAGLYAETKLEQSDLTADYRRDLELVADDGKRAKAHLIEANLRLVVSVAKKYTRPGVELLDVVQEGNLGLIRAVEKFDYTKGFKFSTYAMWWIRQGIQRGFTDLGRVIRLPAHILESLSRLSRLTREWLQDHDGVAPTSKDLALIWHLKPETDDKPVATKATGRPRKIMDPAYIEFLMEINRRPASFSEELGEDHLTIGELIEDVDAIEVADLVSRTLLADLIWSVLDTLDKREAKIMAMHFGLYDGHLYTLTEIGREIGVTRARVGQLVGKTLEKLRHPDRAELLLDYAS